uniref:Multiple inositol polyphosphate phosphatase 1 n=1 Tax=Hyaloperonospora arabidopsidis (strain Emoy2) TaxID=559515 RepID=M4BA62_HYAAE
MTRIQGIHSKLVAGGIGESLSWVGSWKNPYLSATEAWLADRGVDELIGIGTRLRARLSHLPVHYNSSKFFFEHTWKIRTRQSAEAFAFGFFDGLQPVYYHSFPTGDDEVLRFYDNCPTFELQIEKNKSALGEHAKYRDGAQMHENLEKFQKLAGGSSATQEDMEAAYAGCAFDVAVLDVYDHWCSFFDEKMLLSMDYFQDLKHFYRKSHGFALSYAIAAPLLQDIFRTMKQRVDGESDVEGYFRFAHAETILPLVSLLNVSYFDLHLSDREGHFRADTPLDLALQRKFKSSELAPFSANIGFVLYECAAENGQDHTKSTFKVKTLLQEQEVIFNECNGQALCSFDELESIFRRWIYEFDFHDQCALA